MTTSLAACGLQPSKLVVVIIGFVVILFLGWLLGDKHEPPAEEETGEPPNPGGVA